MEERYDGQSNEAGTETGRKRTGRNSSNTATTTATGGSDTGTGTAGTDTGTGTTKRKTKEKEPLEVAVIVPEEKPKKKRKPKQTKKEDSKTIKSDDISALLIGVSNVIGSKPKQEHWKLTKQEAKQISDPLANIIEKSETLSKIAEHSDSIALATACITVIVPKAMVSFLQFKAEREVKKNVAKHRINTTSNKATKSGSGNGTDDREHSKQSSVNVPHIDDALYSTVDQLV